MGPASVVEELPFFEAQGEIGISQVRGRLEFDPVGLLGTLHLPVEMGCARGNGAELDGVLAKDGLKRQREEFSAPIGLEPLNGERHLFLGEALDEVEGEVVCAQLARCEPAGDERSVIVAGDGAVDRAGAGLQR
jgi:hypothetical protein